MFLPSIETPDFLKSQGRIGNQYPPLCPGNTIITSLLRDGICVGEGGVGCQLADSTPTPKQCSHSWLGLARQG